MSLSKNHKKYLYPLYYPKLYTTTTTTVIQIIKSNDKTISNKHYQNVINIYTHVPYRGKNKTVHYNYYNFLTAIRLVRFTKISYGQVIIVI